MKALMTALRPPGCMGTHSRAQQRKEKLTMKWMHVYYVSEHQCLGVCVCGRRGNVKVPVYLCDMYLGC